MDERTDIQTNKSITTCLKFCCLSLKMHTCWNLSPLPGAVISCIICKVPFRSQCIERPQCIERTFTHVYSVPNRSTGARLFPCLRWGSSAFDCYAHLNHWSADQNRVWLPVINHRLLLFIVYVYWDICCLYCLGVSRSENFVGLFGFSQIKKRNCTQLPPPPFSLKSWGSGSVVSPSRTR